MSLMTQHENITRQLEGNLWPPLPRDEDTGECVMVSHDGPDQHDTLGEEHHCRR